MTLSIGLSVAAAAVLVAYSYVLQLITDIATGRVNLAFSIAVPLIVGYLVIQAVTNSASEYVNEALPLQLGDELRRDLFSRDLAQRPNVFGQQPVGNYVTQLTKQVDIVTSSYFHVILRAFYLLMLLVFAAAGTLLIDPVITLAVVLLSLPALIFPFLVKKPLEHAKDQVVSAIERYTSRVTDSLSGFTTIAHALAQPPFHRLHQQVSRDVRLTSTREQQIQKITSGMSDFLGDIMYLGTWLVGAYFVRQGQITLGQLVAFSQLASFFNWPLALLTEMLAQFYGARKVAKQLAGLARPATTTPTADPEKLKLTNPLIEAHQASYQKVLHDIELRLEPDQKYLLVGASGSGKTTLMRLLLGELTPTSGRVTLSGQPAAKLAPASVFGLIGELEQQADIFAGTVRENVTLFSKDYTDDQVAAALRQAGMTDWLATHGLDTVVDRTSPLLSGGEKQRVSLARLLLRHYQFMVLDEMTTGLDPQIADRLQADIFNMKQGFVMITHQYNAATFAKADRIFVMAAGRIVAAGTQRDPQVAAALDSLALH
ncbi:abc transporter atp-binding and membrane spanning permease [Lacticaseibacillus camelliae DSM 22697 = JCM 13995]|uniref:Abc transporter atp-binding and membrane spanning permease n=1 Tax=Lacticaseibacillus camelliae DSM 22697 = JCM 13995 TaxID=1423730 RepID=A0A0R2F3J1_9LACO|nr:abc transporter atp-binding and membrane spanning permease [Lacticaseibacillus camelliae DSM 22697 = JCM 13995]